MRRSRLCAAIRQRRQRFNYIFLLLLSHSLFFNQNVQPYTHPHPLIARTPRCEVHGRENRASVRASYQSCFEELQLSMITPWLIDNWLPTHKKCSELRLITFFHSIPLIASGKIPLKPHRASNYLLIIYRAFCFHCGHVAPRKTWNLFQEFSSLSSEPFCYFSSLFLAALRNASFLVNLFVFNWSKGARVSLKHHMSYGPENCENENKLFVR